MRVKTSEAHRCIRNLEAFTTHGALRGEWINYLPRAGRLPDEFRDEFRRAFTGGSVYVVWSYTTPIGWKPIGGEWVIPSVKYSPTTTNHQRELHHGAQA